MFRAGCPCVTKRTVTAGTAAFAIDSIMGNHKLTLNAYEHSQQVGKAKHPELPFQTNSLPS